ncbi:MAG: AIPR family protein, partial [Burkholderiaceae bacterium]|nr:AIPR family protein [Burkholderiaceae bacterium]
WSAFSTKFKNRQAEIDQVLLKPDVSVVVAVAFTGDNKLGDECQEVLQQFQQDQNSAGEFLETKILDLKALHRIFRTATLANQLPFTGMLLDWGQINEPHQGVYGRICCEELAKLYLDVGEALFEPNIRSFLGDGEVNNQIFTTLTTKPEDFWYLNNGVTGICNKFSKTALGGGDNRQAGAFVFHGIQFVNGAQTIGSIARAYQKSASKVAKAFVHFKVISLEGTPLGFTDTVTLATNKQNKVEEKDFLTLDPDQNRIKVELLAQGIQYIFRSGESVIEATKGFDVTEAMIALACASPDISNAVLAKRNMGMLLDRKSSAYQAVFNSSVKGTHVWGLVQAARAFDSALQGLLSKASSQRQKQILTHGNRVLLWLCLNSAAWKSLINQPVALTKFLDRSADLIDAYMKKHHPDSYLAVFFKNTQKCTALVASVAQELAT